MKDDRNESKNKFNENNQKLNQLNQKDIKLSEMLNQLKEKNLKLEEKVKQLERLPPIETTKTSSEPFLIWIGCNSVIAEKVSLESNGIVLT